MDGLIITGVHEALVIPVAFDWPSPDRIVEAIGTGAAKRAQRANRAGQDQITDRFKLEKATQAQVLARLAKLKDALAKRLLADQGGTLTEFRQFNLTQLSAEVDRLTLDAQADLAKAAERDYTAADQLGTDAAQEPMAAAQLAITKQMPGLDRPLVQAAFGNTVDLLTPPMQQYATQVKVALRGVALAGDNKFAAIAKLRDQIGGPNFEKAQYQAERIIRTELGRTFNTATFERLVALSRDFPFLRKGWRATKDSRVRMGHREAGINYARGQGIKIDTRFSVAVYDERPGKTPKLLGVATLLYPVDPGAKPEGRLAAGATIMCRCNGFVDFNLDEFASYTKNKVATALGDVQRPAAPVPAPKPVVVPKGPIPGDDLSLAKSLKSTVNYYRGKFYGTKQDMEDILARVARTGAKVVQGQARGGFYSIVDPAGATFGPTGWKMPAAVKVKKPTGLPIPKPATVAPKPVAAVGPQGTAIGSKLQIPNGPKMKVARDAMALLDKVHGDGPLDPVPLKPSQGRFYGQFTLARRGYGQPLYAKDMKISNGGLTAHPLNTIWHETGHWLDSMGLDPGVRGTWASAGSAHLAGWRNAVKNSQAVQTLQKWKGSGYRPGGDGSELLRFRGQPVNPSVNVAGYEGDGTVPKGVNRKHLTYLLQTHETFARSYAQYIAVRSGDPVALAELRRMQAQATTSPVDASTPMNHHPSGTEAGAALAGKAWDYPNVWSDADFAPIAEAFDQLFANMGWRKHGGG